MEIVGFVHINKNATTCKGAKNPSEFIGQTCAVIEFDTDGGALVLNPQGTALAMFDKEDFLAKFECRLCGDVICPPDMDYAQKILHSVKCLNRKGGYDKIVQQMVIESSLRKGHYHDSFLWQLQ